MAELIEAIFEQLSEHWSKIVSAALFALIGWVLGKRKAAQDWQKREFYDRLNISLNLLQDGKLKLRTLNETLCKSVFPNSQAAQAVIDAAKKTTPENPILDLPKEDYWYFLNAVLNEISEQFAAGVIREDLGMSVVSDEYLICLTSEADGGIRMRKVRVLMIKKSLLTSLPEETPKLERETHITRWQTLKKLAAAYEKAPHQFLSIFISQ
ncbi:hypothetical protein AB1L42_14730 [Thalassoglobus sp. JC818]|uniref:hypothetical protein n=1 Tax=Thalassoglobus sp. JC818 TaxID=3232136 RepID=UPI00345985FF